MKRLAILGASGHGKVVAEVALSAGWASVDFYDDAWPGKRRSGKWVISGDTSAFLKDPGRFDGAAVAIGNNAIRMKVIWQLQAAGIELATLVHPSAMISDSARLGAGAVAMAGAVVNADAVVGAGVILNTLCSVDHDCVLGDGVHISPGAHLAGDVRVGEQSWVGIGVSIRQGVTVGRLVTIGAGAAVVCDIADNLTVAGVPAKELIR
ncbi:acetyltransferase [Castellaniella sp. GW247-6E4]|uniref:acetyltransferase n=1 Tax=Castellaniella sp. GW247-6E4 TaxID=3140380 RepID=UPI003314594C